MDEEPLQCPRCGDEEQPDEECPICHGAGMVWPSELPANQVPEIYEWEPVEGLPLEDGECPF